MSNLCMGGGGQFVDRAAVAEVITPNGTVSWKPVPHIEVIDAVTDVVKAHNWTITEEQFGLAREGQKLFGVMKINKTSCVEWTRCIGLRNSHDKSFAVGLSAGINVLVCSNLAFGGILGVLTGAAAGAVAGNTVGKLLDENVFRQYRCPDCGYTWRAA